MEEYIFAKPKPGLKGGIPYRKVNKIEREEFQRGFVQDTSPFEVMGWYKVGKYQVASEPEVYTSLDPKQNWFDPKPSGGRGYTIVGVGRLPIDPNDVAPFESRTMSNPPRLPKE